MSKNIEYKKDGKSASMYFSSHEEAVRYYKEKVTKIEAREKALGQKYPELRAHLEEEKKDYKRMAEFIKYLMKNSMAVRNEETGKTSYIECRGMEA